MKLPFKLFLLIFFIFQNTLDLYSQVSIGTVVQPSDGLANGSIALAVIGNESEYSFTWSSGESESIVKDKGPGLYFVSILQIESNCQWNRTVLLQGDQCVTSVIALFPEAFVIDDCAQSQDPDGSIDLSFLAGTGIEFVWKNTDYSGLILQNLATGSYCIEVFTSDTNCPNELCFDVGLDNTCTDNSGACATCLVINETSNGTLGYTEYVELLVKGDEDCNPVDIRGFILDDNDGMFSDAQDASISYGAIRFADHPIWSGMEPGSLILIYNDRNKNSLINLDDDPIDSDGDKVFVVPISSVLFNTEIKSLPRARSSMLGINSSGGSWSLISINEGGDALQIKYPDGGLCHSISFGPQNKILQGPLNSRVSLFHGAACNISLMSDDPYDFNAYIMQAESEQSATPGAPNNDLNARFIEELCGNVLLNEQFSDRSNYYSVYPNPFSHEINIIRGETVLSLIKTVECSTLSGQILFSKMYPEDYIQNIYSITPDVSIVPGVYIITLRLYSGEEISLKISKI